MVIFNVRVLRGFLIILSIFGDMSGAIVFSSKFLLRNCYNEFCDGTVGITFLG